MSSVWISATNGAGSSAAGRCGYAHVGSMLTWTAGVSTGYRFVIKNRVEITPSIGSALVVESGGMSPATARGVAVIGLTAGVVF